MFKLFFIGALSVLLFCACDGNVKIQGSSEYENNTSIESVVVVNGDTVRNENTKKRTQGGGEVDINISSDDKKKSNDENITEDNDDNLQLKERISCKAPISGDEFQTVKQQLIEKHMDDDKLKFAKKQFNERCITSAQVRDLVLTFSLDKYKLDFAKFAFGRTTDRINFAKVNDAFKFSKTAEQLTKFVNEQ